MNSSIHATATPDTSDSTPFHGSPLTPAQRWISLAEFILGAAIVIGHNVYHVIPNEVPILFVIGLISLRMRDGGWRVIGLYRPTSWKRTVLFALAAAATRLLLGQFVTDPLTAHFWPPAVGPSGFNEITGHTMVALRWLLIVWTFAATPRRHLARACAVAVLILTLNEALLGALLVLLGHTAGDTSPSRAVYLGLHLTNTLLLLAALALTAHFLSRGTASLRGSVILRTPALALSGLTATLIVGVTGSLAALGDTLYPAHSLAAALEQDFSSGSSWLLRIRWMHPAISLIAGLFIVWLVVRTWRRPGPTSARPLALAVILLLVLQYLLGVADLAFLTPTGLQMTHLLGADLLWIALVILSARVCLPSKAKDPGNASFTTAA